MNKRANLLLRRLGERMKGAPDPDPVRESLSLANEIAAVRVLVLAETEHGQIFVFESDERSRRLARQVASALDTPPEKAMP